jgi:lysophospholipid acyltransferase (LPLAT)-like uncharacterized protein
MNPSTFQPRPLTGKTRLLAWLIHTLARTLYATLRLRFVNDGAIERLLAENPGLILVTWHGRILLPLCYFRDRGYWTIVSASRDGDLTAESFRRSGFRTIRGSTSRRSVIAIREVLAALAEGGVLAFVPDGPRGPSQKVQPGVAYFAQRLGFPILPVANSAWPRWLAPSWDRFLVPYPFARAVWVNGEPIRVGPDDDLEEAALRVERGILAAEAEAERLVAPKGSAGMRVQ